MFKLIYRVHYHSAGETLEISKDANADYQVKVQSYPGEPVYLTISPNDFKELVRELYDLEVEGDV